MKLLVVFVTYFPWATFATVITVYYSCSFIKLAAQNQRICCRLLPMIVNILQLAAKQKYVILPATTLLGAIVSGNGKRWIQFLTLQFVPSFLVSFSFFLSFFTFLVIRVFMNSVECQSKVRLLGGLRALINVLKRHINDTRPTDEHLSFIEHVINTIGSATAGHGKLNTIILLTKPNFL